jgi:sulfate adenylyltransferase subunit 2
MNDDSAVARTVDVDLDVDAGISPLVDVERVSPPVSTGAALHRAAKPDTVPRHLRALEAEAIYLFREVVAEFERPVLLYSIGKDSSVLLHLARKAFAPGHLPFPLLHVATGWDFREMLEFRDRTVREHGDRLIVHTNPAGLAAGLRPWDGPRYADVMLTEALKQALDAGDFDVAFGGGRRDEEKSRAKERMLSFRDSAHRWDPRQQRPELWRHFNGRMRRGQRARAFPLSNWTEADVWSYIHFERIPLVPLYFARPRPVVERNGALIVVDDERLPLRDGERPRVERVRFRTLGCYPLTAAIRSTATTVPEIVAETLASRTSERAGRLVDGDQVASMERKKSQGYF